MSPKATSKKLAKVDQSHAEKLNQVCEWVLSGASEFDIAESFRERWPSSPLAPVLAAVVDQLRGAVDIDPAVVFGFCFEGTKLIYAKLIELGDYAGALKAIRQLDALSRNKPQPSDDDDEGQEGKGNAETAH